MKTLENEQQSSQSFYRDLTPIQDFDQIFDDSLYQDIPGDWFIFISDIKGSTKAVEEGRYKDVNTIGAACIAVVEKIDLIPSVFGGDGASFLVPSGHVKAVGEALCSIKELARQNFALDLRVSAVPVHELYKENQVLKVGKYELAPNKYVAKFMGGGLAFADNLIKEKDIYEVESTGSEGGSLANLSCRWEPIANTNGTILTLLVKAKDLETYKRVLFKINQVIGKDDRLYNPIKIEKMSYLKVKAMIKNEIRLAKEKFSLSALYRIFEIFLSSLIFDKMKSFMPSFISHYTHSIPRHSDFRKFDDTLRMVIDCSLEQASELEAFFAKEYQDKNIYYGTHRSNHALMTCLVESLSDGGHIHFIDGADGGYTSAAKVMKKQLL